MNRVIVAVWLIAAMLAPALPVHAATPPQSFAAAEKARGDTAAKARAAAIARAASQAAALAHHEAVSHESALIKIKSNVLAETRARIEAADKAAQVNAAIIAASDSLSGVPAPHPGAPGFRPALHRLGDQHWFQRGAPAAHPRVASGHH
jgi:hypothetical protein